jgi:hypothetical protein
MKERRSVTFGFVEVAMEYVNEDNWVCGSTDHEKALVLEINI